MTRILLLFIAVLVLFWLLRRALSGRKPEDGASPAKGAVPLAPALVACAHCGVLLPQNEAVAAEGSGESAARDFFCTEEHLKLGPK